MTKPYEWTGLGVQSLNSAIHRINHYPAEKITAGLHLYLYFKVKFVIDPCLLIEAGRKSKKNYNNRVET